MAEQRNGAVPENTQSEHHQIVVIGAGFAGIGLAVKLQEAGFEDFVVLERGSDLGGVWSSNTYPGCACDVPSHLYSYSFAPNPNWTRTYGKQEEILEYLRSVATERDALRFMRFGVELLNAEWSEANSHWSLDTSAGAITAHVVISAAGLFGEAAVPNIKGLDTFAGKVVYSLDWDHEHDFQGENIAVIGTGASSVQIIPEIAPLAEKLTVFQRSAPWIMPRVDRTIPGIERILLRRVPLVGKAFRSAYYAGIEGFGLVGFVDSRFRHPYELIGRLQLLRQVRDPELRKKVTPDYMIGCKRAIFSDAYYPTLSRDNVEVVTDGIAEIRPHSIVDKAGVEHRIDTLVLGTGFVTPPAAFERYRGRDGRTFAEMFLEHPRSYLGAVVSGFPNFFFTLGPFGAVGNQSAIFMIESQIHYIIEALKLMRDEGATRVEIRKDVQDAFMSEVDERSRSTVWLTGGCNSYYTTAKGDNAGLYPNWSFEYRNRTRKFDRDEYEVVS